jgi:hypothetical protein
MSFRLPAASRPVATWRRQVSDRGRVEWLDPCCWIADTNGDGLPDEVRLRIVLPASPSPDVAMAAAELAARLGHDTMAATLPIVVRDLDHCHLQV